MTIRQIPSFEKQNNTPINVYKLHKEKKIFKTLPTYLAKNKQDQHVDLLLIQDQNESASTNYQYVWIKRMSRLLSTHLNKEGFKKYFCNRCMHFLMGEKVK